MPDRSDKPSLIISGRVRATRDDETFVFEASDSIGVLHVPSMRSLLGLRSSSPSSFDAGPLGNLLGDCFEYVSIRCDGRELARCTVDSGGKLRVRPRMSGVIGHLFRSRSAGSHEP